MRSLAFNVWFHGMMAVLAVIAWLSTFVTRTGIVRQLVAVWSRAALWGVRVILRGRVEVRGLEHLPPEGPKLIVSKYQSELDVVVALRLSPEFTAVAMKELERYPVFGCILVVLDLVLVRMEGSRDQRTKATIEGAVSAAEAGRPMLIYPEGNLMNLGAKERYRNGAWHIYDALGCEAYPVAMSLGTIWPRRDWRKNPGQTGAYEILPPIPPGLDQPTLMARLEEAIETRTMELIREHATGEMLEEAERRYRDGVGQGS